MRVAIDIRRVGSFGIGTYIRNVVRLLARIGEQNEYVLIGPPERFAELGELPANFTLVALPHLERSFRAYFAFDRIVREQRCDIVHVPHMFWRPRAMSKPYLVTAHDVLTYMFPRADRSAFRRFFHKSLSHRALANASRILSVSHFTKTEIVRYFKIPEGKIEVIPNAIDERFRLGHATDADRALIAERYQVNYPFLLYAGNIKPHKNLGRIIEAFSVLKAELKKEGKFPDLKLIIIGDELSQHPDLRRTVVKSGVGGDVRFLGFVSIDTLRIFYDLAKIFVFPSLYEGFGLPPLEAMALGTPVVTSNTSSLPEVVGQAAVLVNPENVFEITRALRRVLLDQELRDKLKVASIEQAQRFSWETSVRRLLEVYNQVGAASRAVQSGSS
ncbi:MAG TPA: glycosyltransferase family 1 protein [Terriglobales bacterium]|nr:glycosyltransferase family 1 protein [Terriglobales bacterium]